MLYEVRDYHYRPDLIDAYEKWAVDATVVLRGLMDVVGFWVDRGECAPDISGPQRFESPIGAANVTWVIRWPSKAARDEAMKTAFTGPAWQSVWARHPDPNGYRQLSSRFMHGL